MHFAEAVKYVREISGFSQEQLARELNVSFATINRWENERAKPRPVAVAAFDLFCKKNNIVISINEKGDE